MKNTTISEALETLKELHGEDYSNMNKQGLYLLRQDIRKWRLEFTKEEYSEYQHAKALQAVQALIDHNQRKNTHHEKHRQTN